MQYPREYKEVQEYGEEAVAVVRTLVDKVHRLPIQKERKQYLAWLTVTGQHAAFNDAFRDDLQQTGI